MHHAGMLIFMVIGLTLLFGSAHIFMDKFFYPAEFEKLVEKKPFRKFIKRGFCVGNGYLSGTVGGYQVLLGYHIGKHKEVRKLYANIIFKPKMDGVFMTEDQLNQLNSKYQGSGVEWSINSLDIEFKFESSPPRFDFIESRIQKGIEILVHEGFEASTLADSYRVEKEIWDTLLSHTS